MKMEKSKLPYEDLETIFSGVSMEVFRNVKKQFNYIFFDDIVIHIPHEEWYTFLQDLEAMSKSKHTEFCGSVVALMQARDELLLQFKNCSVYFSPTKWKDVLEDFKRLALVGVDDLELPPSIEDSKIIEKLEKGVPDSEFVEKLV